MKITAVRYAGGELILSTSDPEAYKFAIRFKEGDYTISRQVKPRGLNANAMYWSLLTKLANAIQVPVPYLHNLTLRKYGQPKIIAGSMVYVVLPDTDEAEEKMDNDETVHLKPTSQIKQGKDGLLYRTYIMLRGSHDLNVKEFSALLDGLIDDCKAVGLDILSDRDRALLEEWDARQKT